MTEEMNNYIYEDIVDLSGPSHAEEVALRHPTTVTVSSVNEKIAKYTQDLFFNKSFRVYTRKDMFGIVLGGALKNIIALGAGISNVLGYGDILKSVLFIYILVVLTNRGTSLIANPL